MRRQSSGSKPPKNPKKKAKPSPASMPVTPEVEVPPKATATAAPEKDVINVDDLPEEPVVGSDKGASSSHPPPEEPDVTSTEVPAKDVERKLKLSGATGTPQTHPQYFPVLTKVPLSQRHAELTKLMEEVWGNPETEQKDLAAFEDGVRVFFAKHKHLRQVTPAPKHWFRLFRITSVN